MTTKEQLIAARERITKGWTKFLYDRAIEEASVAKEETT